MKKFGTNKSFLVIGLFIYRIILELTYVFGCYNCQNWGGLGYEIQFDTLRFVLSWVQFGAIVLFVMFGNVKEQLLEFAMILMAYIPGLVLIPYIDSDISFTFLYLLYWVLFLLISTIISKIYKPKTINIPQKIKWSLLIDLVFIGACLAVWLYFFFYTDAHVQISLFDVYDKRENALTYRAPRLLVYIKSMANMSLSLCMVEYISKHKWLKVMFIIVTQYINFSIDGSKIVWVTVCIAIAISVICKIVEIKEIYLPLGFSSLCILGAAERLLHPTTDYFIDFGIRRCLLEAQRINYFYYDFFMQHELDYFRQGILRFFGNPSPYNESIARVIGKNYYKIPTNATNGLFSEAYSNLGICGVFLMPIILAVFAKVVDWVIKDSQAAIRYFIAILFAFVLCGSSLSTALLSHGILLGIILSFFIIQNNRQNCGENI